MPCGSKTTPSLVAITNLRILRQMSRKNCARRQSGLMYDIDGKELVYAVFAGSGERMSRPEILAQCVKHNSSSVKIGRL